MRARHPGMLPFEQNGRHRAFLARLVASERTELAGGKSHSGQVTPKTNNSLHVASVHDGIFGYSNKLDKMKFPDGSREPNDILLRVRET